MFIMQNLEEVTFVAADKIGFCHKWPSATDCQVTVINNHNNEQIHNLSMQSKTKKI